MTPTRLSALFLTIAALAGSLGLGVPSALGLSPPWSLSGAWDAGLRITCIGALAAFLVTFLMTLDRSSLVKR